MCSAARLTLLFMTSVVTYIDRVNISVTARQMMPAFGQTLSQSQVKDLLAYLHTL